MEYITNENNFKGKRVVLISSYCDTKEKIDVLINTIKVVKSYNLDVMVNSPLPLPSDVINMCDFYLQTKENPLLNWPEKSVMSWARYVGKDREIVVKRSVIDYGWAALYQTKKLSEYALTYDYDRYYHIIYDTEIDDTVVSTFLSDKKCNFFPFHEHKVSLHLIALDRENLLKFSNLITFDSYLKFNCIVENWLYNTLINSDMNYKIELEKNKYKGFLDKLADGDVEKSSDEKKIISNEKEDEKVKTTYFKLGFITIERKQTKK